jgi:hypothetical protein
MDEFEDVMPEHIRGPEAHCCLYAGIDEKHDSVCINQGNNVGEIADQRSKPLFPEHSTSPRAYTSRTSKHNRNSEWQYHIGSKNTLLWIIGTLLHAAISDNTEASSRDFCSDGWHAVGFREERT